MRSGPVQISPLLGIPLIEERDCLTSIIISALGRAGIQPEPQDILVIAQKIVSKSEGRSTLLRDVSVSPNAQSLAEKTSKDPRLVELILSESSAVLRFKPGVLVTIHKLGYIMANAGIDQSNVEQTAEGDRVLLLPIDPDNSCAKLKQALDAYYNTDLGIVINDSFGRPWRKGVVSVALGSAGLPALRNLVGKPDLYGRSMRVTESAFADQVATAAAMVMGETNEAIPVVHIRGLQWNEPTGSSRDLIRDKSEDMFQ